MSTESITVHVDRGSESLEATTTTFEAVGSFDLIFDGGEIPAHVHCRLEGDLLSVAHLEGDGGNFYVEPDGVTTVPVVVEPVETAVSGTIEISTGYGATSLSIDVAVVPSSGPRVDVDDRLGKPPRRADEEVPADGPPRTISVLEEFDPGTLGVVGLAIVAMGVAAVSAAVVGGFVALAGFLIVTGGIAVATALLLGWDPL